MEHFGDAAMVSRYDQIRRLVELESRGARAGPLGRLEGLCRVLVAELDITGAAIKLMSLESASDVIAAAPAHHRVWTDLEFASGEGPSREAFDQRQPVLTADLTRSGGRWPGYAHAALTAGIRAVYVFPLHLGGASLGVLEVYHDQFGPLDDDQVSDALTLAQLATDVLLATEPITAGDLDLDLDLDLGLASAMEHHSEIYQAQGMLMVSLSITLAEAMALIRSYAFAHDLTMADVADRVRRGDRLAAPDHVGGEA